MEAVLRPPTVFETVLSRRHFGRLLLLHLRKELFGVLCDLSFRVVVLVGCDRPHDLLERAVGVSDRGASGAFSRTNNQPRLWPNRIYSIVVIPPA